MRYLSLFVVTLVAFGSVSAQNFRTRFRSRNSNTRLGLLGPQIGVPPVPGAGAGPLTSGPVPSLNSIDLNSPGGCFCLPINQVCNPRGPVPVSANRIKPSINTRIVNLNPQSLCGQDERPCCFLTPGGPGPITTSNPFPFPIRDPGCGKRRPIFPGTQRTDQADFGEYPWMAAILGAGDKFLASGAIIEPGWILTAAHKLTQSNNLVVRVGDYDLSVPNEFPQYPHQTARVAQVIIHPKYDSKKLLNDVALLRLQTPVAFGPSISNVCLPEKFQRFSGQRCYVSGWGQNSDGQFQPLLREVDLPIVDEFECEARLRETRLGDTFQLDRDSFLCAGGEAGKDACKGDGGAPLVCDEGGFHTVVGLVAWGIGCGQNRVPGVYVNVATFSDFINNHVYRN